MDRERERRASHRTPTRSLVLAWADAHTVDISNAEADDLVRRLWHPPAPFDPEAVERCVTDALLLLAESEAHDEPTAERLRGLAAKVSATMLALGLVQKARCVLPDDDPVPSDGVPDMTAPPRDDDAPGTAINEEGGRPMRYDLRFERPVAVTLGTLGGRRALATHVPFDGRVRVRPDGEGARPIVVPLDELGEGDRRALLAAPTRRRVEVHVRCVRRCGRAYRAWLCEDMRVETTGGEEICRVESLFAARCEEHRIAR